MQVETYEQTEVTSEGVQENDAECVKLIEQLGLNGQRLLILNDSGGPVIMPYRKVTAEEHLVYGLLFPSTTTVEEYALGPIPLRVLQVIAHARDLFAHLLVWHPQDVRKDPVLVGLQSQHPYPTSTHKREESFLLARWGEALRPFSDLKKDAVVIARQRVRQSIMTIKAEIDRDFAIIDSLSDNTALRTAASPPSYHSRFDISDAPF